MLLPDVQGHLNTTTFTSGGHTYPVVRNSMTDVEDSNDGRQIALLEFIPPGKMARAMGGHLVRENAGLEVWVRGPQRNYDEPRAIAQAVYDFLDGTYVTLSGRAHWFAALHAPIKDEQDRNGRWKIVTRFKVSREQG